MTAAAYLSLAQHLVIIGVAVWVFYRAGEMEEPGSRRTAVYWAGFSAVIGTGCWLILGWGWLGMVAAQAGLGVVIGIVRAVMMLREQER